MGINKSIAGNLLELIFEDTEVTSKVMEIRNNKKINNRFGLKYEINQEDLVENSKNLSQLPNNFNKMFYFSGKLCKCCRKNLTLNAILEHIDPFTTAEEFILNMV